jgi:hypothetical protein
MLKEELVIKQKWISPAEFNKARAAHARSHAATQRRCRKRLVACMLVAAAGARRMLRAPAAVQTP